MDSTWEAERRLSDFLGLTLPKAESKARDLALDVRVLRDGDKHFGRKMNLNGRRVNLWLDDGRVTEALRF